MVGSEILDLEPDFQRKRQPYLGPARVKLEIELLLVI